MQVYLWSEVGQAKPSPGQPSLASARVFAHQSITAKMYGEVPARLPAHPHARTHAGLTTRALDFGVASLRVAVCVSGILGKVGGCLSNLTRWLLSSQPHNVSPYSPILSSPISSV